MTRSFWPQQGHKRKTPLYEHHGKCHYEHKQKYNTISIRSKSKFPPNTIIIEKQRSDVLLQSLWEVQLMQNAHGDQISFSGISEIHGGDIWPYRGCRNYSWCREYNRALIAILEVAKENNITFKMKKNQIGMFKVDFSQHLMSTQGLKVAKDKVRAIQEMPSPRSREELWTQLGLLNYLSKFVPNISELAAPLHELLKKDIAFRWELCHE